VDASVDSLDVSGAAPDKDGVYTVVAHVGGVSDLTDVPLSLTGGASLVGATPAGCTTAGAHAVVCDNPGGDLTFHVTTDQPAPDSRIVVGVPDGYVDTNPGNDSSPAVNLLGVANLHVTKPDGSSVDANPDGTYSVPVSVDAPADLPNVIFTVTGATVDDNGAACRVAGDGTTVTCTTMPTGDYVLTLTSENPQQDTKVAVTAHVPDGYVDPDTSDNAGTVTLTGVPVEEPFRFQGAPTATPLDAPNEYAVTANLVDVPADAQTVTLVLGSGDVKADQFLDQQPDGGCTVQDKQHVTCPTNGQSTMQVTFYAQRRGWTSLVTGTRWWRVPGSSPTPPRSCCRQSSPKAFGQQPPHAVPFPATRRRRQVAAA
jgi:hypothetical protein